MTPNSEIGEDMSDWDLHRRAEWQKQRDMQKVHDWTATTPNVLGGPYDVKVSDEPVPNPISEPKNAEQDKATYSLPYDAAVHGPREYYDKVRRTHGIWPHRYLASKATSEIGDTAPSETETYWAITIIGAVCLAIGFLLGAIIF